MPVMSQEAKNQLKGKPRTKCGICYSPQRYKNSMERCNSCKKKFCFDHITVKLEKEVVNYCDNCL